MDILQEHYTPKEVRESLKISKTNLYSMIHGGNSPPFVKIGKQYRFPKTEFDVWLKEQELKTNTNSKSEIA